MPGLSDVLVYEYFSGGGFPKGNIGTGIATEALAMLWALAADFRRWGSVRTVVALDPRFENCIPGLTRDTFPADEVVSATAETHEEIFLSLLNRCDTALIVAPETDGILSRLSAEVERSGKTLLGSGSSAIAMAGDKETCGRILLDAKLPTPETRIVELDFLDTIVNENELPLVLKPVDGIGSEGVCLITELSDIHEVSAHIRRVTSHKKVLLQPFVDGIHASVSLLAMEGRSVPLSLNRQLIRPGKPFQFYGAVVPFEHVNAQYAVDMACAAVHQIEGLRGYVGVDLVLQDDAVQLIEINPRLTTSYIGLRQTMGVNTARLIYTACKEGVLPDCIPLKGRVTVMKDDPATWGRTL